MSDNKRKRGRKAQLVKRTCDDLDDEKVRNVQEFPINPVNIKQEVFDLEPSPHTSHFDISNIKTEDDVNHSTAPVAFRINVEVEEYNEDVKNEADKAVTDNASAENHAVLPEPFSDTQGGLPLAQPIKSFTIDLDTLYNEVDKITSTSDNVADAVLAIELRNYWGAVLRVPLEDDPRDVKIQEAIQKWKSWHNNSKYRDVPLFYKCYICEQAWWHLQPFRNHLLCHDVDSYRIEFEESPYECNVMAYGTVNIPSAKDFHPEGECWRCNKPFPIHSAANKQNGFYFCKCCEERFHTCTDLKSHEGVCWQYLKYLELEKDHQMVMCNLCKCLFVSKSELAKHMVTRHSVRSDIPVAPQYRLCSKCNRKYFVYPLHCCPRKTLNYDCSFCFRNFLSKMMVDLHLITAENDVKCKICDIHLAKKCMALAHYKKHTDNFIVAYKCSTCTTKEVHLDLKAAMDHRWVVHKQKSDKRRHYFEKVLLPRSYCGTEVGIEEAMPGTRTKNWINAFNQDETPLQVKKTAVQKTYKKASKQVNSGLKVAVTQTKQDTSMLDQQIVNISQTLMDGSGDNLLQVIEQPYNIQTQIKSEPMDEEYESDIIRLSIDNVPNVAIKDEPLEFTIKTEIEDETQPDMIDQFIIKEEIVKEDSDTGQELTVEPEVLMDYKMPPKLYCCSRCGYKNVHRKYKKHILTKCKLKKLDNNKTKYPCPKCRKNATSFNKYILHFSKHGYPHMSCPVCVKTFENMTKLQPHVMMHIKQSFIKNFVIDRSQSKMKRRDIRYQCRYCREKVDYDIFVAHWVSHSSVWCKKEIMDQKVMEKGVENVPLEVEGLKLVITYLQTDSAELKIKDCVLCERHFDRKNDCKRHLIEHLLTDAYHNKQRYGGLKCQICPDLYQKPDHYKLHMRDHGSLPVYRCDICDRTFSDSSNFTKHKKLHNLQVLICDICNKKFQAMSSLVKHMEIHKVTKPVECELCGRVYYTESAYKKHKRIYHEKSMTKFKCCICRERFITLKEKWDHLWLVHQERKLQADCPICKKGFRKMRDVNTHIKDEHSDIKIPGVNPRRYKTGKIEISDTAETNEIETLFVYE